MEARAKIDKGGAAQLPTTSSKADTKSNGTAAENKGFKKI